MGRHRMKEKRGSERACGCRCGECFHGATKKSNITAERVTLLPGFLTRSKVSRSSSSSSDNGEEQVKVRRSWRLSQKNQPVTISGYFSKLVSDSASKSIFKEIKCRYEKTTDDFEQKLHEQLKNFKLPDSGQFKGKIHKQIENINAILLGKHRKMSGNRKRAYNDDDTDNFPIKLPYIPQSNWVFQTPPNRKLNFSHVKVQDSGLKPAVIESNTNKTVVYEMNKKINVDLTGFSHRQQIDIDKRYMVQAGDEAEDSTLEFLNTEPFELENHFLSLTCRPKKVAATAPRFANLRRKRDIFEPQPGSSTDKPNFCFLENVELNELEESFTFKFTSNENVSGSTTGHLFDVDGVKKNTFNFQF